MFVQQYIDIQNTDAVHCMAPYIKGNSFKRNFAHFFSSGGALTVKCDGAHDKDHRDLLDDFYFYNLLFNSGELTEDQFKRTIEVTHPQTAAILASLKVNYLELEIVENLFEENCASYQGMALYISGFRKPMLVKNEFNYNAVPLTTTEKAYSAFYKAKEFSSITPLTLFRSFDLQQLEEFLTDPSSEDFSKALIPISKVSDPFNKICVTGSSHHRALLRPELPLLHHVHLESFRGEGCFGGKSL